VVTVAGTLLAAMVTLRAGIWIAAKTGLTKDFAHDCCSHDHGHDHSHDHEQHAHSHEVSIWRLVVVSLPLMMLMAGLVPTKLSAEAIQNKMSQQQKLAAGMEISSLPAGRKIEGADVVTASMVELVQASRDPSARAFWESIDRPVAAKVVGQLMRTATPGRYQLQREKMTCCAQDAVPVIVLVAGKAADDWQANEWLEVTGPVSFQKDPTGGFTAVLHQASADKTSAPADIYLK
jgi:uncharacterized membrane protein YcgQ (UPF0703/DUF1980 family)